MAPQLASVLSVVLALPNPAAGLPVVLEAAAAGPADTDVRGAVKAAVDELRAKAPKAPAAAAAVPGPLAKLGTMSIRRSVSVDAEEEEEEEAGPAKKVVKSCLLISVHTHALSQH
jgi:hypothetical protein